MTRARYLTANDTPGRHALSWYAETAGHMPERASLAGDTRADVCVVGGGYAGLSAALHLADRGYDVVLLEANRVGWGASGRNGGQIGVGPRADIRDYERRLGREDAARVWQVTLDANALVRDLCERFSISADLAEGSLEAAWKPGDPPELAEYAEHLARRYGYDGVEVLDAAGMAERLETRRYHGGLAWRDGGHLHPLRYALGLAEAAATAGARIREHSPVTALRPGRVVTREGTVRAEHVILAMNGYVDGLEPEVARTVAPINSLVCATEPLGRERAEALMRTTACVFDTRFVLDYYRMTSDTRLVWGGAESYGTRFPRDIEVRMKKRILAVFPQLADVAITHAWGGTLGITRPRAPAFQRLGKSMLSVAGWSGSGIHMATMGGLIAADAVAGQAERFDLLARMPVPPFPGGDWLRQPLLALALSYYALRDRL